MKSRNKGKSNKKIKLNKRRKTIKKQKDDFKKVQCSPRLVENEYTCYSNESLIKLRDMWNARHPDAKIETNEPQEIWSNLKNKLKNVCNKESCWLKQKFITNSLDKDLMYYTFAPKSPDTWKKNPNEWLTSIDIENVMKQYEREFPYFDFIGPSPIDFDTPKIYGECVWEELCHFDLATYIKKGKNRIGIIFNTDPHYLPGSHWISMFINTKKKFIFFFDSTGDPAPKEINQFINKIKNQGKQLGIDFTVFHNEKKHQKKPTECGIYSLFMIINLLKEIKGPEDFVKDIFPDEEMEKFRKLYFNDEL